MPGATAIPAVPTTIFTQAATLEADTHTAILQLLNRMIGEKWFGAEEFEKSVRDWKVPTIFAQAHPDLDAFDADPEAELERIGGRIVGTVQDPRIEVVGHPRLMGELDWAGDPEIDQIHQDGELSLSTAFRAPMEGEELAGPPRPHHVLIFREIPGAVMPRDLGAVILNQENTPMAAHPPPGKLRAFYENLKALMATFGEGTPAAQDPEPPAGAGAEEVANAAAPGAVPVSLEDSYEGRTRRLYEALEARVQPLWIDGSPGWIDIVATYDDSVIYRSCAGDCAAYQIPYSLDNGAVVFGDPVAVEEAYVETAPPDQDQDAPVRNQDEETDMDKSTYERELAVANQAATDARTELQAKDAAIANLTETIAGKETENEKLRKELEDFRQAEDKKDFDTFCQQLKPVYTDSDEKKVGLFEEWKNNKTGLLLRAGTMLQVANMATNATGAGAVPPPEGDGSNQETVGDLVNGPGARGGK